MRIRIVVLFSALFFGFFSGSLPASALAPSAWTVTDAAAILKAVSQDPAPLKVLNVWATWCPPCKAEIPEFIKFSTEYPKIPVYFVSGDDAADAKTPAAFLHSRGAREHLYQLDHVDDKQLKTFGPAWAGALPGTFIYDQHGKLLKFWVGSTTAKLLAERIKALDPSALKR